ncbi:MAG: hypothetical protein LBF22_07885 [Deltaproteobacteria bacterium]|jgi:hypothetical protein|nr:hypothetical protein [Deltaproteobacteria bacterium]
MNQELAGRLIIFPDLFPYQAPTQERVHYLSWPAWETFLSSEYQNPLSPDRPLPHQLDHLTQPEFLKEFAQKDNSPLTLPDPPNFKDSLKSLLKEPSAASFFSPKLPFSDPMETLGNIKAHLKGKQIPAALKGCSPYLILALWTLREFSELESSRLLQTAKTQQKELLEDLLDTDYAPLPTQPVPLPPIDLKMAKFLYKTWLTLATDLLTPFDRVFSRRPELNELLV